jgi:hypothetical protein
VTDDDKKINNRLIYFLYYIFFIDSHKWRRYRHAYKYHLKLLKYTTIIKMTWLKVWLEDIRLTKAQHNFRSIIWHTMNQLSHQVTLHLYRIHEEIKMYMCIAWHTNIRRFINAKAKAFISINWFIEVVAQWFFKISHYTSCYVALRYYCPVSICVLLNYWCYFEKLTKLGVFILLVG